MNFDTSLNVKEDTVSAAVQSPPIVVVGAGPVGVHAAQELSKAGKTIVILNAETTQPYNRVKLTPLLSGEAQIGQILQSREFPKPGRVRCYDGVSIIDIDPENKTVTASSGRVQPYEKLILAIGSRAFVPSIAGAELGNVFTFRDIKDASALFARSFAARKTLVIGGGLLGLEAARGMSQNGAQVTVVEHEARLMPRQLDAPAAEILKAKIEAMGITVKTGARVTAIRGQDRVQDVEFDGNESEPFDTVIVCTGVRANTHLAAEAGLAVSRGILTDTSMRTSNPDIYAIGECAEVGGHVIGLVGPGFEQAKTAVEHIIRGRAEPFANTQATTKLKVLGVEVFSIGEFESSEQQSNVVSHQFHDKEAQIYRRILLRRGKLVAAIGVGPWPEAVRLQQALSRKQTLYGWNMFRFRRSGALWSDAEDGVDALPSDAIICNCTGVTKGAIRDAITLGAQSVQELQTATSCSTVCGTCKPLVLELLGQGKTAPEPARWWRLLIAVSGVAAVAALASLLFPRIPLANTYVIDDLFRNLWYDSIWKQYSGYSLLALTGLAALIGLRKRIGLFGNLGGYDFWRITHLVIGAASALVLIWHSGFRIGSNLNLVLMLSFLTVLVFGAVAGLATGSDHELTSKGLSSASRPARRLPLWVHIIGLWPLPALILFHVLAVYVY